MATQTPNFKFDLRESADIFNPLSTNANFESLDTILKNLQETGGITTYTTTAAANLLKLSGTPKVNDTVFKFVAAGDANTWTGATGGVINNIVALDGKQVTIKGGNMYVAWVNSANAMVVVAWPAAVDAKTFDGKGPDEWASKAQLDAVNQTAANATQTAQAAQTVANNALQVAQAAGLKTTVLWTNPNPRNSYGRITVTLTKPFPSTTKAVIAIFKMTTAENSDTLSDFCMVFGTSLQMTGYSMWGDGDPVGRMVSVDTSANTLYADRAYKPSSGSSFDTFIIPYQIIAVEW